MPFRIGRRPAHLVTAPALLELALEAPPAGAAVPADAAERAGALADSWVEGHPVELFGTLRELCRALAWDTFARTGERGPLAADRTHAVLTWTLHLLAQAPAVEARWHADPNPDYTALIVREAMRLFPPVWGEFRVLDAERRLGEHVIGRGHVLALSAWFTHRDGRYWPDPLRFDPERPPEGPYFPGQDGAQAAAMLVALGERWAYRPAELPEPRAGWTLAPHRGARFKPVPRA